VQSAAHPVPDQAKELAQSAADLCNQVEAQSSADSTLPSPVEMLVQSAADMLVQLVEDLTAT